MKKLFALALAVSIFASIGVFPRDANAQTLKATGSSGVVTLSWEPYPGALFYDARRVQPNPEELFPKPFLATTWTDISALPDSPNTYEVKAYDANLKHLYTYPTATAKPDASKKTLSKPCHVVLSFSIGNKEYTENGSKKLMTVAPLVRDGKSYLVIRHVMEPLFGTVGWEASTKKVTIKALGHTIIMWVGNPKAMVDGVERPIDPKNPKVAPFVEGGRTFVPLRFPVEALGTGAIEWFADTKTAVLSFKMGCEQQIDGSPRKLSSSQIEVGSKIFDIPMMGALPENACMSVQYQIVEGKTLVGRTVFVPCEDDCRHVKMVGEVQSVENSTVVMLDSFMVKRTLSNKSGKKPEVGKCISACVDGSSLVSFKPAPCPQNIYEGQIVNIRCEQGIVSIIGTGRSLTIKLPPGFDCSKLSIGQCIRCEGQINPEDPTLIVASQVSVVQCKIGSDFILFAQSQCDNFKLKVMDLSGTTYTLNTPTDFICGDVTPGDCLKVVGSLTGGLIDGKSVEIVSPPKDSDSYRKAIIISDSPYTATVPGGATFQFIPPSYHKGKLKIGVGFEIWGKMSAGKIVSPKIAELAGFAKTLTGTIVGQVCSEQKVFVKSGTKKIAVTLFDNAKCDEIQFGQCFVFTGEKTGEESFLCASMVKTDCEQGCQGQTVKGVIVGVDCAKGQFRARMESDGSHKLIKVPSEFDCASLRIGLCFEACVAQEGEELVSSSLDIIACKEPLCYQKLLDGIVTGVDCAAGTVKVAIRTKDVTFKIPETVDCQTLSVGQCMTLCMSEDGSVPAFIKPLNCQSAGTIIDGTVLKKEDGFYSLNMDDGSQILLKSERALNPGDCVIALGEYNVDAKDQFFAKIVGVVECKSGAVSGQIVRSSCEKGSVFVKTTTDVHEVALPGELNCRDFLPGDCVIVINTGTKTIINKIACPQTVKSHTAMLVLGVASGEVYGTDLTNYSKVRAKSRTLPNVGEVVIAQGLSVSAGVIESAVFSPLDSGCVPTVPLNLKAISFNPTTKVGHFIDAYGSYVVAIVPNQDFKFEKNAFYSIRAYLYDTGLGPKCHIAKEVYASNENSFKSVFETGVIFAINRDDEIAMLHIADGRNIVVRPKDPSILNIIKVSDCANVRGKIDQTTVISEATLEVSDCQGGSLGKSFTGVVVGINSTNKTVDVASDSIGTYEVTLESAAMLTGLSLGDCVAVSGMLYQAEGASMLGRTVSRIDCKQGGNEPVSIEGDVTFIESTSKSVSILTADGVKWTAFLERPELCAGLRVGTPVRCSGRLMAKQGLINKAYIKRVTLPTFRWSLIGQVVSAEEKSFKVKDFSGREWQVAGNGTIPTTGDRVFVVGMFSLEGVAEIEKAQWVTIGNWEEPKTITTGTVFGLSCGMDKLLVRDSNSRMNSVRLPHSGFCGQFSVGECVTLWGRIQATIPQLSKVTDVKHSSESCNIQSVFGTVIARSLTNKIAIIVSDDGKVTRLGFDTEVATGKCQVGLKYKVTGKYLSAAPDTLKVTQIEEIKAITYKTIGRILQASGENFIVEELSLGRSILVKPTSDKVVWDGWNGTTVYLEGSFDGQGLFTSTVFNPMDIKELAAELEGKIASIDQGEMIVNAFQGSVWRIEGSFEGLSKGDDVFVVGWVRQDRWWTMRDARAVKISGVSPTAQMLLWGNIEELDCENNKVSVRLEDGSLYTTLPEDRGICESLTKGERIQVSGQIAIGYKNTISGARLLRSGVAGSKKQVIGMITEVSCTSRIIKISEQTSGGVTNEWTVQLAQSVACDTLKVGLRVRAVGDTVPQKSLYIEDAAIEILKNEISQVKIVGTLENLDCAKNLIIINSQGILYRVMPSQTSSCKELAIGDILEVTANVSTYRKHILDDAKWVRLPPKESLIAVSGKIDMAKCPQLRIFTDDGEFWRVNMKEGQPCDKLSAGMWLTLIGTPDAAQDHLMNKGVVMNLIQPKLIVGFVDDILCDSGKLIVADKANALWEVQMQDSFEQCLSQRFAKGDAIQVEGFQNILYVNSPILYARVTRFGNEAGLIPMDFIAEVIGDSDCKKGTLQVRTNQFQWTVKTPDGFECSSIKIGDYVRIQGGRESFTNKLCVASSIQRNSCVVVGSVVEVNNQKNEIVIAELNKMAMRWRTYPKASNSARSFQKGEILIVTGTHSARNINESSYTKLTRVDGRTTKVDLINQSVTLKTARNEVYTVFVRTEWVDLSAFKEDQVVYAIGLLEGKDKLVGAWLEDNSLFMLRRECSPLQAQIQSAWTPLRQAQPSHIPLHL